MGDEIAFSMRVRLPDQVRMAALEGESVMLHLERGQYFGLDEVGTRMLQVLSEADSIQTAFDDLLEEFEVDPGRLERDLRDLIGQLKQHGLIELSDQGLRSRR